MNNDMLSFLFLCSKVVENQNEAELVKMLFLESGSVLDWEGFAKKKNIILCVSNSVNTAFIRDSDLELRCYFWFKSFIAKPQKENSFTRSYTIIQSLNLKMSRNKTSIKQRVWLKLHGPPEETYLNADRASHQTAHVGKNQENRLTGSLSRKHIQAF